MYNFYWKGASTMLTNLKFKHPNNRKGTGRIYLAKGNKLSRYPDFTERKTTIL